MRLARCVIGVFVLCLPLSLFAQQLEIHYIDVGWGGSVFIKGPDGTTVLLEAGNTGKGTQYVVPYLQAIGVTPAAGLDYMIGGHQHCDHIGGLDEVINAGYNVHIKNYYNGSSTTSSCVTGWNAAAATTTAGAPVAMPVGQIIQLGNGATLTCVARNGSIIGGGSVAVTDENDRSIALLLHYGGFDYLWASDLGGGTDACTGRSTGQVDVETSVINAITGGASPLVPVGGIDLLHVNHHGSESSTNPTYFNKAAPQVAIIGVGDGESTGWDLPRIDVVEHVLFGQSSSCVTSPPAQLVLQTEEGNPIGSLASHSGYCVGNIKVTTDGLNIFNVSADGAVHQGPNELATAGLPLSFTIDGSGGGGDTIPPTTSITAPANGATVSGTTSVTASASDNVGVTKVEFYLDGALKSTDTASPYAWSWDTTTATNGSHSLTSKAYDAALNTGTSSTVTVTVSNGVPISIGSWTLTQANATATFTIPAGTTIPSKGYVILARNCTKAQFQTFWGVTLAANVVFLSSGDVLPQINGSETYTLKNSSGTTMDGPTIAQASSAGQSIRRTNGCGAANLASSWSVGAWNLATPGTGAPADCNKGVYISEFSDALGTGNFIYEFVELHNDR